METTNPSPETPIVSFSMEKARQAIRKKLWLLGAGAFCLVAAIVVTIFVAYGPQHEPQVAISSTVAYVTVDSNGFVPSTMKVKKGQEITWSNNDTAIHHLLADQSDLPSFETTEPLDEGDSYTYIFDKAGTYRYYDTADPQKYVGTIIVE